MSRVEGRDRDREVCLESQECLRKDISTARGETGVQAVRGHLLTLVQDKLSSLRGTGVARSRSVTAVSLCHHSDTPDYRICLADQVLTDN